MSRITLLIISCVFVLLSCADKTPEQQAAEPNKETFIRAEVSYLNESYARLRKEQLDDVRYKLSFNLSADASEFTGVAEIEFELLNTNQALTLDFTEGKVEELILNGDLIDFNYNNWFISIDQSLLEVGPQHLSIKFSHPYSLTGSGLYRSIDPEDGFAYIYSDLEPYDANRIFPAFDQPA